MSAGRAVRPRLVLIGIGNEFRHDDGAAAAVLAELGALPPGRAAAPVAAPARAAAVEARGPAAAPAGTVEGREPADAAALTGPAGAPRSVGPAERADDTGSAHARRAAPAGGPAPSGATDRAAEDPARTAAPAAGPRPGDLADRVELCDGEPTRVIELWRDADLAVVLDAVHAHPGEPGRIHEYRLHPATEDVRAVGTAWGDAAAGGSHALGLGDAAALGAALGRLPRELVVVGIEGADFGTGVGLSPVVARAVPEAAARVRRLVAGFRSREAGAR